MEGRKLSERYVAIHAAVTSLVAFIVGAFVGLSMSDMSTATGIFFGVLTWALCVLVGFLHFRSVALRQWEARR